MPAEYVSTIGRADFKITWGVVHPGQNFESVSKTSLQLNFGRVTSRAGYVEIVDTAFFYILPTENVLFLRTYAVGPLLPASFTLRTSRTSPDEPQPVAGT